MIYLDYAAATPMSKKVIQAMTPYFEVDFYNPSAAYGPARAVRADYNDAKHRLAKVIGAKPAEIVITAGATESINLAFGQVGAEVITTAIEHPAVLECAKALGATILPVDEQGRVNLDQLRAAITDQTRLISVGYANNEIGTIQPIKAIAEICAQIRLERSRRGLTVPLVFHTDASQAAGLLDISVARLGVDLMTLNASKCYGPKQVGLLYVRAGVELAPIIRGGGQEAGLRSGTENVAGAVGFAAALEIAETKRKSEVKRLEALRNGLEKYILEHIPEFTRTVLVKVNSRAKHRLPNLVNFSLSGLDGERLVYALDQRGIQVATGSACAANKGTGSHVLRAIGLSEADANGSLRVSLGRHTTENEINMFQNVLAKTIEYEQQID
jgi:cysteine desulfurase